MQMKDSRNSPYLFHSQSTSTPQAMGGGDDSDTSQSTQQQRRKIARGNGRIRKNTSILDKLAGVNSAAGHSMRKSFKMKIIQQQFNDSPQMESFMQHGDSGAPSRVSREFDTILGAGTTSQTQMTTSSLNSKTDHGKQQITQADITQHLVKDGFEVNTDCIQSADEDSRNDSQQYDLADRKRASTYDIPYYYYTQYNIDEIVSYLLPKEVNESRAKTHKRQWLTDDVWRKQHYSRSSTILVNTNNSQIVSQLKQISQATKGFQDCKHVRYTFSLIKEYQQMMESCNLFLFILIDFQEQPEKAENILQQTAATIRECEERMGVPKTYIIGYVDFQQQGEFLNKNYEKLDFWINHETDLNQHTLIEYVTQIKKKEIV